MAHLIHHWTTLAPLAAAALLVPTTAIGEQPWLLVGCVVALIAAVLAAVHHAEVIAHRVGEPLVTLGTGRTSMTQGAVHLVLFVTYLFLACVP
jgi:Ca2+:H+ antiporter